MTHILKCSSCGSYGLKESCQCGAKRERNIPAKFSPDDKYAEYRRQAKEELNLEHKNIRNDSTEDT
jgi:rRNA maturation protein Nop10